MPLNPNQPHAIVCGVPPYGAKYEQNGLYFRADGSFAGPPDAEDAYYKGKPSELTGDPDAEARLLEKVAFLKRLILADKNELSGMAKEVGIQFYGNTGADKMRREILEKSE